MQDFEINQWLLSLLKLHPQRSPNHQSTNQDWATLEDWQCLLDKAIEQKVAALLYFQLESLPDLNVPKVIQDCLNVIYRQKTFFNMALMGELKSILNIFNANKIPVIVLKGAYLAKEVYPKIGLREMVDIDLLVPDNNIEQAANLLEQIGYRSTRDHTISLEIERKFSHELPPFRKSLTLPSVDLHWTICEPHETYLFDLAEYWQRAKPTDFFGETALSLTPEDLILHLCHHASYHHEFDVGIRPLCDLARIIEHFQDQLDWETLQATAEKWQWQKGLYLMLALTHHYLEVDLPDSILQAIQHYKIDQQTLAIAKKQLFEDINLNKKINRSLQEFIKNANIFEKAKLVIQRIFQNPQYMSTQYPVRLSYYSPRLYFYYLVRIRDLWRNHGEVTQKALTNNESIISINKRKDWLNQWLLSESE